MELNAWTKGLRAVYDKALSLYRDGNRADSSYFADDEKRFLASIGLRPINVYDYVEDFVSAGEPDWETFLLIASARRDYFLFEQKGSPNLEEITDDQLAPMSATLDGIAWLPRIIQKAQAFLQGSLCHDIMYCCGGDRRFLKENCLHPADFLRAVWTTTDDQKILRFVGKFRTPNEPAM
jgi:hypothetical protein